MQGADASIGAVSAPAELAVPAGMLSWHQISCHRQDGVHGMLRAC